MKINLLRLDLTKVRLNVRLGMDQIVGTETTSSIAARHGAVAAINAGFFRLDSSEFAGTPAGVVMVEGELLTESRNNRIGIVINNKQDRTDVNFYHIRTQIFAGFGIDSGFTFDGINRERKPDEIVLFTPRFANSTRTDGNGIEIVLSNCESRDYSKWCKNAEIIESKGNNPIPKNGLVISIGKNAIDKSNNILHFAKCTNKRPLEFDCYLRIVRKAADISDRNPHRALGFDDITNGVPQLIKDGKIDITWEEEKASRAFVFNRHPRTAVAEMKEGKFLMITVDGRQPGVSVGMTLQELAEYLLSLGAVDAMNLDGGGSTTMVLDGKVVNKPSDPTGERKIGDAIVVTLRKTARPASRKN
ncbi:MAG: phosphodiester glycosidase family protein [Acidobacteria bacterium]|nr:phosphodiester glycosidase family protein [Acidobacteriota bacterium]